MTIGGDVGVQIPQEGIDRVRRGLDGGSFQFKEVPAEVG